MKNFKQYLTEIARKQFDRFSKEASTEELDSLHGEYEKLAQKNKIPKGFNIQQTTLKDLKDLLSTQSDVKSGKEIKKETKGDAEKVFENDNITVVIPKTYEASCLYGSNTKWCITSKDTPIHFNSYSRKYNIHYIIPKDGSGKIAVIIGEHGKINSIWDDEDKRKDIEWLKDKLNSLHTSFDHMPWKEKPFSIMNCLDENGYFDCSNSNLTSLDGCPAEIKLDFDCSNNKLTSLRGCPTEVKGNFDCSHNKLTSLHGSVRTVGGSFICNGNKLTSLDGCPMEVKGSFNFSENQLTSLDGCPMEVTGDFNVSENQLTSLDGCPTEVKGRFRCSLNPVKFSEAQVRAVCKVGGKIDV